VCSWMDGCKSHSKDFEYKKIEMGFELVLKIVV
jgi:hypothetical protein